jgi:CheY-like chemotaxis protein
VGRLAGGIAHDFNNLLTAILGNASLLLRTLPPAEREHELVATMERAAWRAADLTRQLLGFSRRTLLWLRTLDPGTVLDEVVTALTPSLPGSVHLVLRRPGPLWTVQVDPVQLAQVLNHLCRNAIEAMPGGGVLLLEAVNEQVHEDLRHSEARPGSFVRLRVQDTGPGIHAELLDKIFDPFFTTKPVGRGSGLGLAMVYGIVKQHQGWVQCSSPAGEGARFDVYLPRAGADVPAEAPAPTTAASPVGPRVVLLADDNDTLRALAAAYLTQGGFQVLLAADGREAVEVFQREHARIDLVILDQMMPYLTGRDALDEMRHIKPTVRALFATGSTSDLDRHGGTVLGAIAKPYRERDLLQAVHQALEPG